MQLAPNEHLEIVRDHIRKHLAHIQSALLHDPRRSPRDEGVPCVMVVKQH
jgi:hypothetical protein